MYLVIGASGLVGANLLRVLQSRGQAWGTYHANPAPGLEQLDLRDTEAAVRLLHEVAPETVYLPAANPNVDWIEQNEPEAYTVNVAAPRRFVDALAKTGAKLVYYSTDYVFDGASGPYRETDAPNPLSVYGRHKLLMEQYIAERMPNHLILRVAWVFGWELSAKNFANRLVFNLRKGVAPGAIRIPSDQIGNPTYAPDLARASVELVEKGAAGLFHLVGSDLCTRYVFARAIAHAFDLPGEAIAPARTAELNQKARRPLNAGMTCDKAASLLSAPLAGYQATLQAMRNTEP